MKENINSTNEVTNGKRLPRRRMYQDFKVANLLHSPQAKTPPPLPHIDCADFRHTETALPNSTTFLDNGNLPHCDVTKTNVPEYANYARKAQSDTSALTTESFRGKHFLGDEDAEKVSGCHDQQSPRNGLKNLPISQQNSFNLDKDGCKGHDTEKTKRSKIFQRYLFLPTPKVEPIQQHDSLPHIGSWSNGGETHVEHTASQESNRKTKRVERRHTVSGTGSINMKDIEDWISGNSGKRQSDKSDISVTKDDCELFVARPKIILTKLAEKKSSFSWPKKRELTTVREEGEEEEGVMHRWTPLKERNSSCRDRDTFDERRDVIRSSRSELKATTRHVSSARNEASSYDRPVTDEDILSRGINNRISSFLTPRPYNRNVKWSAMTQSRKSWNGYDVIINRDIDRSNSAQGYNGFENTRNGTSQFNYIEDDDDTLLGEWDDQVHQGDQVHRGDAKYDTFLDLSNLDLEDGDIDRSLDASSESCVTSSSEAEVRLENEVGGDFNREVDSQRMAEDIEEIVKFILRGALDKIEERSTCIENEDHAIISKSGQIADEISKENLQIKSQFPSDEAPVDSEANIHDAYQRLNTSTSNDNSNEPRMSSGERINSEVVAEEAATDTDLEVLPKNEFSVEEEAENTPRSPEETLQDSSSEALRSKMERNEADDSATSGQSSGSSDYDTGDEVDFNFGATPVDRTTSLDRNSFLRFTSSPKYNSKKRKSMPFTKQNVVNETKASVSNIEITRTSATTQAEKSTLRSGLRRLFQIAMSTVEGKKIPGAQIKDVLDIIESKGVKLSDPRMRETFRKMEEESIGAESPLSIDVFCRVCEPCFKFIRSVLLSQLTIPGFSIFKLRLSRIFETVQEILSSESDVTLIPDTCSSYNVIMRKLRTGKSQVSMSVCTVDGQRCSFGDSETPHPLNTCASVFNYCLACRQNGIETMSRHVGNRMKPAKRSEFSLDPHEKIWNPFTNAGAMMTSSLLFRNEAVESRIDSLHDFYGSLAGHEPLCCDNLSYNYKRIYAHEEIGLAYYLSSTQRLPRGTSADLAETLDFHFQAASSAMTSDACAVAAATLANAGTCPLTGEAVADESVVRHTLHVMRSSYSVMSPRSAEKPHDIAVAWNDHGSILLVVPGVLGVTCFVQCQSDDVIEKVVDNLIKELKTSFNFGVYRSLKDKRTIFFKR